MNLCSWVCMRVFNLNANQINTAQKMIVESTVEETKSPDPRAH